MRSLLPAFFALCLPLAAAELHFETKLKEFTVAPDATKIVAEFPFKNDSKEAVDILEYTAGCSCITASISPSGKLKYEPGEGGIIRAEFELSALAGTVDKAVALRLTGDKPDQPSVTLVTRIQIPVLVNVEPKTLTWSIGEKPEPKTVTLTMNYSEPIQVLTMSSADNRFTQELKTIEKGKKYEIVVTPQNTDNVTMGVVHVETDCKLTRHRSQRIFMVVRNQPKTAAVRKP